MSYRLYFNRAKAEGNPRNYTKHHQRAIGDTNKISCWFVSFLFVSFRGSLYSFCLVSDRFDLVA